MGWPDSAEPMPWDWLSSGLLLASGGVVVAATWAAGAFPPLAVLATWITRPTASSSRTRPVVSHPRSTAR
jgi:membrane protein implicated in regulation of membrane protease activity